METPKENDSSEVAGSSPVSCSLFIGGRADGQRMAIPEDITTVQIPCNDGACEIYKVERFGTMARGVNICIQGDLSFDDAMEMLLSKYPANAGRPTSGGQRESEK